MKNEIVTFTAENQDYNLEIIDKDGQRWVTSQQLGKALGQTNIRKLIKGLRNTKELQKDKHFCNVRLQKYGRGNPDNLVISYRGVIRVAMRSQGKRAIAFRDWAEDVLYEVMVTGKYNVGAQAAATLPAIPGRAEILRQGINLSLQIAKIGLSENDIFRLCYFRKLGMTQKEAASLFNVSRDKIQAIELLLKEAGIEFDNIPGNKRKKEMKIFFDNMTMFEIEPSRILRIRLAMNLTQKTLGAMLGVSGKQVSLWERGLAIPCAVNLLRLKDFACKL